MAVSDETRRAYERAADELCRAFAAPAPVLSKTSEAPVIAVNGDGTLDVGYGGAVLTVRMTTACDGVEAGDTVLLTAYGQMLYATGVLSTGNPHYVRLFHRDPPADLAGPIELSESAAAFELMMIEFVDNNGQYASTWVYEPDGKFVTLIGAKVNGASSKTVYSKWKTVKIDGTKIDTGFASDGNSYMTTEIRLDGAIAAGQQEDYLAITTVIGVRRSG